MARVPTTAGPNKVPLHPEVIDLMQQWKDTGRDKVVNKLIQIIKTLIVVGSTIRDVPPKRNATRPLSRWPPTSVYCLVIIKAIIEPACPAGPITFDP